MLGIAPCPWKRAAPAVLLGVTLAACSSAPPSDAWTRVDPASIEQPPGFEVVPQDNEGSLQNTCAPCHPAVDTTMTGVVDGPAGLVAVGWIFQDFHGAAWRSTDGTTWRLDDRLPQLTVLSGVAADATRYVAVGLDGRGATAWTSTDGSAWTKVSSPAFAGAPMRMTSIVHWSGGFAIAGYQGTEFGAATPAFWTSPDGLTWQRAVLAPDGFGGRPAAVAAGGPGLVAVGAGTNDANGPAAAWTSADGAHWQRVASSAAFQGIRLRAVNAVPGIGLVAVGEVTAGDVGAIIVSTDGRTWNRAPTDPDLGRTGIQVRLDGVTAGDPGVVIVGTADEGVQYGEAAVWTSPDAVAWTREPTSVAFADAELTAVAPFGSGLVAVGDRGAPDAYVATAWMSPPAWRR